jgi:hypothetical protein
MSFLLVPLLPARALALDIDQAACQADAHGGYCLASKFVETES